MAEQGCWCLMSRGTGMGAEAEQVVLPVSHSVCFHPERAASRSRVTRFAVCLLSAPLLKGQQEEIAEALVVLPTLR